MAVAFEGRAEDESSERNLLRGYEFSMPVFSRRKFGPLLGKKKFSNGLRRYFLKIFLWGECTRYIYIYRFFREIIYSIEYFIV